MKPNPPATEADDLEKLNAAQKAFDSFEGPQSEIAAVCRTLNEARPSSGYIAVHGNGSCRVICGSDHSLTPLSAIPEADAIQLAIAHRIQLTVRFRLPTREWFNDQNPGTPKIREAVPPVTDSAPRYLSGAPVKVGDVVQIHKARCTVIRMVPNRDGSPWLVAVTIEGQGDTEQGVFASTFEKHLPVNDT